MEVYQQLPVAEVGFLGYQSLEATSRVVGLIGQGGLRQRVEAGDEAEILLAETPFYAEAGGQVGDTGIIETETGSLRVEDAQYAVQGLHGHRARVTSGSVQVGQDATLRVDPDRRERIRKSHTGTHLLHWALRDVLGTHVHQAGSLVVTPGTPVPDGPLPKAFKLHPSRPNPFNPRTEIRFSLPVASNVSLVVYDVKGRRVAILTDRHHEPGTYTYSWNAGSLASGVYFYRIQAGQFTKIRKMILMKY